MNSDKHDIVIDINYDKKYESHDDNILNHTIVSQGRTILNNKRDSDTCMITVIGLIFDKSKDDKRITSHDLLDLLNDDSMVDNNLEFTDHTYSINYNYKYKFKGIKRLIGDYKLERNDSNLSSTDNFDDLPDLIEIESDNDE
jgi:hypothetical protein